jgi:hypothetical protein
MMDASGSEVALKKKFRCFVSTKAEEFRQSFDTTAQTNSYDKIIVKNKTANFCDI